MDTLQKAKTTKKTKKPQKLIFVEYMRIGKVDVIISTRGITPIKLNQLAIVLQHQIYEYQLTSWKGIIGLISRTYAGEVLKLAPSYVFRRWNHGKNSLNESEDRLRRSGNSETMEDEECEKGEALEKKKILLLLGDYTKRMI